MEAAKGKGDEVLPLPSLEGVEPQGLRKALLEAQLRDPKLRRLLDQKAHEVDPRASEYARRKQVAGPDGAAPDPAGGAGRVKPLESALYRRSPLDGVLERQMILAVAVLWVPFIPDGYVPFPAAAEKPVTWRRWLWSQAHEAHGWSQTRGSYYPTQRK